MLIHDFEQGSPEWLQVRLGKLTASCAQAIGNMGKGLETLVIEKVTEILTGAPINLQKTDAMERGNELEEEAASIYEMETGRIVQRIGFIEHSKYVGCSPDRLVGDDGLIEIKCPQDTTYTKYLLSGTVVPKYYWQIQMQLLITGRQWCDYVVYNPNFKKSIIIKRIERDEKYIADLNKGFEMGARMIEENLEQLKEAA